MIHDLDQYLRGPLGKAIALKNYDFIAGWLSHEWAIEVTAKIVEPWTEEIWAATGWGLSFWRSDWYFVMMFKNRAIEAGMFSTKRINLPRDVTTCVLHIGFLCLEENEFHLARLRKWDPDEPRPGPSTPGIERSMTKELQPIDRVAARVTQ
jgi:hypothetical protein